MDRKSGVSVTSPNSLRQHRLNQPAQFEKLAKSGKKVFAGALLFKHLPSPDGENRLAFVVRKKCGKAVFRNRVRRILRHQIYAHFPFAKEPKWGMLQFLGSEKEFQAELLHRDTAELMTKMGWMVP
jgi:ribonuclease P protein component